MDDCKGNEDCTGLPNLTPPEPPTTTPPVETVRRLVMAEDPCCPEDEVEVEEEGVTVEICGELRIVNGRITEWPASLMPLFSLMSSDNSLLVNQRGCEADITISPTNANFECLPGIKVVNGRIIEMSRMITEIEFDPETCLEVKGFNSDTCRLVIGLRDGCTALGGGGSGTIDTGGVTTGDGVLGYGGTVVYEITQICSCPGGANELQSVNGHVERIDFDDGRESVYRIGLGGYGVGGTGVDELGPPGLLGSQYSTESAAIDAINTLYCISCDESGP